MAKCESTVARAFQIHLAPRLVTAASQTLLSFVSSLHFNDDDDDDCDEDDHGDDKGYEGGVGA